MAEQGIRNMMQSLDSNNVIDTENIKVLTFDCYGTLIDWESGIYNALSPILQSHNINLGRDELLEIYGEIEPSIQSSEYLPYKQILNEVTLAFAKRFDLSLSDEHKVLLSNSLGDWPAFPDSAASLLRLKKHFKLAIVSNIDNDLIKLSTAKLGVEFDWIITAQNAKAYKPALEVFHYAFKQMNLEQAQVLHVAQSIFHDIAPANKLGLRCIWVNRRKGLAGVGATPQSEGKPDLEVSSMAELADLADLLDS